MISLILSSLMVPPPGHTHLGHPPRDAPPFSHALSDLQRLHTQVHARTHTRTLRNEKEVWRCAVHSNYVALFLRSRTYGVLRTGAPHYRCWGIFLVHRFLLFLWLKRPSASPAYFYAFLLPAFVFLVSFFPFFFFQYDVRVAIIRS
jgi:hypothetical protein